MAKRVFLIILDSFGIGALPDAAQFHDEGSNTMASVVGGKGFAAPVLASLGLFNIEGVRCMPAVTEPKAAFARLAEKSMGKDTTIGHWEIAGITTQSPLPTYPEGFPPEIIEKFEALTGRKAICNRPYSGTQVLIDFGEEQMETGALIVYTSADSVFQVAAHESVVSVEELYEYCQKARELLQGEHAVGRVIARPFIGSSRADFKRTTNRHDFSLKPPKKTLLNFISEAGLATIGVGKISDIFSGEGVSEKILTTGNRHGMEVTQALMSRDFEGLAFVNLVDFDMLYGHRNDIDGYARAISEFDSQLSDIIAKLRADDLLIISADHGCDPGTPSTDHSREYVPMLAFGEMVNGGTDLKTRKSFADIAATIAEYLGVDAQIEGESFLAAITTTR